MTIYLGADHGGFALKEKIKQVLLQEAYEVMDLGPETLVPGDDYPQYAAKVADVVNKKPDSDRGILICRSGFGMDIAANKFPHVRAALPESSDHAYQARHDDDANILVLAADFTDEDRALKIVHTFLSTPFAKEERYQRRLNEIDEITGNGQ
jgi:ribose 5-phosphate isomerase B